MKAVHFILLCVAPVAIFAAKCTDPTTEPPTTEWTSEPSTEPPTTQPPTTEPPTTEPPTTEPPTTEPPTTEPPTTEPPTTEPPTQQPTDPTDPAPEEWPFGKFSLLRAGEECAKGNSVFKTGARYQDTEDDGSVNDWPIDSPGIGAYMKMDGFDLNFCTKKANRGDYNWPSGEYCVLKFGNKCPFQGNNRDNPWSEGSIFFDDEDDNNANRKSGTVPAGTYDSDTQLKFCCREDGGVSQPILLPATKSFYMFAYRGSCQRVAHMDVTEEVVHWDTEDDGSNVVDGETPENTSDWDVELTLCLYTPQATSNSAM